MKKLVILLMLLVPALAGAYEADQTLSYVYGSIVTDCQAKQLATTGDNRLTTALSEQRLYLIYGTDGAGAGAAIKCLQGDANVTVSGKTGFTLFSGEKIIMRVKPRNTQLSCESFASTPYVHVCLLD